MSEDGKLIFLTHNSNRLTYGHFSILSVDEKGSALFSRSNTVAPYSPPGIFWNPTQGNFDGGQNNQRDVVIWSYMPTPTADGVGPGRTFSFQLSTDFNNNTNDFEVNVLAPEVDWQTTTPPLIASKGLSLYWSVSRSKLRAWTPASNSTNSTSSTNSTNSTSDDGKFDQSRTGEYDFDRGDPSWLAPFTTPQVDDEENPRVVCMAGADPDFYCLNAQTLAEEWKETTTSLIKTDARFSTKGDRVYFIEEDGVIYSFNAQGGRTKQWEQGVDNKVLSNFDLSSDGGFLYCGDETGQVSAYQLSTSTLPPVTPMTRAPTAAPSVAPPSSPSSPSSQSSTSSQSSPSLPTASSSRAPNSSPTNRPIIEPTSGSSGVIVASMLAVAGLVATVLLF